MVSPGGGVMRNAGALKRPTAAYGHFVKMCCAEHKRKYPNENLHMTEISKKCAEKWKTMSDAEKQRFFELAETDVARYQQECAMTGVKPTRRRQKKDPNAPKRNLSAFFFFSHEKRPEILMAHPDWRVGQVAQELGRMWREIDPEGKTKFEQQALGDRQRYETEMQDFKAGRPVASVIARQQVEAAKAQANHVNKMVHMQGGSGSTGLPSTSVGGLGSVQTSVTAGTLSAAHLMQQQQAAQQNNQQQQQQQQQLAAQQQQLFQQQQQQQQQHQQQQQQHQQQQQQQQQQQLLAAQQAAHQQQQLAELMAAQQAASVTVGLPAAAAAGLLGNSTSIVSNGAANHLGDQSSFLAGGAGLLQQYNLAAAQQQQQQQQAIAGVPVSNR